MTTITLDDFRPWVQFLKPQHQQWFGRAFDYIISNGFELYETSSVAIANGNELFFKRDDCYIYVGHYYSWQHSSLRPGIVLYNEIKEYEMKMMVNTPTDVVRLAIAQLHNENV